MIYVYTSQNINLKKSDFQFLSSWTDLRVFAFLTTSYLGLPFPRNIS